MCPKLYAPEPACVRNCMRLSRRFSSRNCMRLSLHVSETAVLSLHAETAMRLSLHASELHAEI